MNTRTTTCKHCGAVMTDDPGAYYHQAACEADAIRKEMKTTTDPQTLRILAKRLEYAEYVGD